MENLSALANLSNSRIANTPLELNVKYNKDEGSLVIDPTS